MIQHCEDFEKVLDLEPRNDAARTELQKTEGKLKDCFDKLETLVGCLSFLPTTQTHYVAENAGGSANTLALWGRVAY